MKASCSCLLGILLSLAWSLPARAADVPASARSRAATARTTPVLAEELKAKGLHLGTTVFIRIFKEEEELELWLRRGERFERFRTLPICSFSGELGPKLRQGDQQAPEGFYFVTPGRLNPSSSYHLSLNLGYPNQLDRRLGRTGNYLMVHGNCVSIGCYAMTDSGIEEIWTLVDAALRAGQPFVRVHIFPFRMTNAALARHSSSKWHSFWSNLKEGFDLFERDRRPPDVSVRESRYRFTPTQ